VASGSNDLSTKWLRGLLEACVLGILRSGPAYGYDIAGRIEHAGLARPQGGTLYPILARLESDGLVEPAWIEGQGGPSRKYYALTARGVAAADDIAVQWAAFSDGVSTLMAGQTHRSAS
jgi:PadR family transcriptional regulator PadR